MKNLLSITLMFALMAFVSTSMSAQATVAIGGKNYQDVDPSKDGIQVTEKQAQELKMMLKKAKRKGVSAEAVRGRLEGKVTGISQDGTIEFDSASGNDDGKGGSDDGQGGDNSPYQKRR